MYKLICGLVTAVSINTSKSFRLQSNAKLCGIFIVFIVICGVIVFVRADVK